MMKGGEGVDFLPLAAQHFLVGLRQLSVRAFPREAKEAGTSYNGLFTSNAVLPAAPLPFSRQAGAPRAYRRRPVLNH